MSAKRSFRSWLSMLLVAAMIVSMVAVLPAGAAPAKRGEVPKRPQRVTTASGEILASKMDAKLRDKVAVAGRTDRLGREVVDIAVLAAKGSAAPKDMTRAVKMKLRADDSNDLWVGKAAINKLTKIASGKDVAYVYENGRREPPVVPDSGTTETKTTLERKKAAAEFNEKLAGAKDSGVLDEFRSQFADDGTRIVEPPISYDGGAATGWYDVSELGHNSVGAWDLGYTGTGVKVAVADDSCDFGHPDLMDTQAVIEDPSSPYDGWPQAFDPFSLLLYAYDAFFGDTYVADGATWFSDTSATMTESAPTFNGRAITTPGTSVSGVYHMGYLWDENYYWSVGRFPMILVADENTAGVYDTVYVDLYPDYDFSYEKPCTKNSPVSYIDIWNVDNVWTPDGLADISGGMVYWIADGTNQPPGFEFMYGDAPTQPGSGDMVCFMGALNDGEDHGTLCSSNVVGQGLSDGPSVYGDYPAFKPAGGPGTGIVQGAARDSGLVAIADIYWNHFASTLAAYDYVTFGLDEMPGTGDDVQVISNSYGESDDDADSWDYRSRYVTALNTYVNPNTAFLFSTGNGAPGYGTNSPPTPATGIAVGASTQMGAAGGWDSIDDIDQVTVGDVIPWSNRGPTAAGGLAPHILADGAYSSGAVPLNMFDMNGASSWDIWGGTSRSCPVAAGNLALVYEAYYDANGEWPDWQTARRLLMNGARDLNYDTLTQGAGMIDAGRSAALASQNGGIAASPAFWQPGDFLGEEYLSFANTVHAGQSYTSGLTLENTGASPESLTVSDAWYQRTSVTTMAVTLDSAEESPYDFNRPDYLTEITDMVPPGTELVVARVTQDFEEFAPTGDFDSNASTHNTVRPLIYDWKDQDGSMSLWDDANDNGYVNEGEIDSGEYMRFTYHNNFANAHEVRVQTPLDRMHDGVFFGLQHNARVASNGVTTVTVEFSFWSRADMPWLSASTGSVGLSGGAQTTLTMTADIPASTPVGVYEGEYRISDGTNTTVVPVVMNVVSPTYGFEFGQLDAGGEVDAIMPNNQMYGAQDWNWRAESGDWRFFSADGSSETALPDGAAWLVKTTWPDNGAVTDHATDNDTLLYGPAEDVFSGDDPATFGPYGLGLTGGSANTNIGAGIWTFQTNSGTTQEWVAGPLSAGLNQVMLHNVLYDGKTPSSGFAGAAGVISVAPSTLPIVSSATSGAETVDFTTYTLPLTGVAVEAYGLTRRADESDTIAQGDDWYKEVTLTDAAYLDISTACPGQDIDLYLYRWNGSSWSAVGASETSSDEERIRIERPTDGDYLIDVYGYSVSGTQTFDVSVSSPMGHDLDLAGIPSGAIGAGEGFTMDVDWTKDRTALADREGTYEGIVYLGPTEAPGAVQVPVTLRYPFEVEAAAPASADTVHAPDVPVVVQLSKRVDPDALDASTFHVDLDGSPIAGTIAYDDASASITFAPDDGLAHMETYDVVIEGLSSVDGDSLDDTWSFLVDYTDRAMGADRYQTAVDVSVKNFPSADTVLLATGERFPDALAASGLAGALDAPLLLTRHDALPEAVADEIGRLGAEQVVLIGGTDAISASVASEVDALAGVSIDRVFGADRYATAAEVAREIEAIEGDGFTDICFLARGDTFPDALALSPFAYSQSIPILLTGPTVMPQVTSDVIDELGFSEMLIAGQTSAVSLAPEATAGLSRVERAGGVDRYATAAEVAEYGAAEGWGTWSFVGMATGTNFPDGLAGGVGTGANGGVLLLTPRSVLSSYTAAAIEDHVPEIGTVEVFGGANAVTASVKDTISALLLP